MKQTQNQFYGKLEDLRDLPTGSTFLDVESGDLYYGVAGTMVKAGNFVANSTTGEPAGSSPVLNAVSLTQAEYDAGPINSTTLYNITDA
jgi:hypothetical protein